MNAEYKLQNQVCIYTTPQRTNLQAIVWLTAAGQTTSARPNSWAIFTHKKKPFGVCYFALAKPACAVWTAASQELNFEVRVDLIEADPQLVTELQ